MSHFNFPVQFEPQTAPTVDVGILAIKSRRAAIDEFSDEVPHYLLIQWFLLV